MTALQLDTLIRDFGSGDGTVRALDGVTLGFEPGTFTAVMGPSGSGKSTLLQTAAGLDRPTSGRVHLGETEVSALGERALARLRRERLGFVFQSFNLLGALTAAQNVALPSRLAGRKLKRQQVAAALAAVGLEGRAGHRPAQLSGGQQQRVAIARALVGERRLVLADEPTGALDSQTGEAVLHLLRRRVDAGAAAVLVTHEARHAAWADRVIFLRDGVLVDSTAPLGSVEQLLSGSGR